MNDLPLRQTSCPFGFCAHDTRYACRSGATGTSYTLPQDTIGKKITVTAIYTDLGGVTETVTSNPTLPIGNINKSPSWIIGDGIAITSFEYDSRGLSLALQPDGKSVVAGNAYNGANFNFAAVRYNNDGSLDTTFGVGGKVMTAIASGTGSATRYDYAWGVAIQSDGKIVVAGNSQNSGNTDFSVVRL